MNQSIPFAFESIAIMDDESFSAQLGRGICTTEQLMRALYQVLVLPGYFGFNWNALNDCLNEFSWIQERKIVLNHAELPRISDAELKIYLEILRDAVVGWKDGDAHTFEVVFNILDKEKITSMLYKA